MPQSRVVRAVACLLLFFLLAAAAPVRAADGGEAFRINCAACHTVDGASTVNGPSLKGVLWRKIAVLRDFRYSPALKAMVGAWTPSRLDAFLRNTQAFAPGTEMFWTLDDAPTRRAIIDYLKTQR